MEGSGNKKLWTIAIAIVALIAVAGVAAIAVVNSGPAGPFEITYELYGGNNDPSNPKEYMAGDQIDLSPATKDGSVFGGWYLDEDMTLLCMSITKNMKSDITLHAKWCADKSETAYEYRMSSYYDDGMTTIKYVGTEIQTYVYYNATVLDYYMGFEEQASYQAYQFNKIVREWNSTDRTSHWDMADMTGKDYLGVETVVLSEFGKIECDVFLLKYPGATEKRWVAVDGTDTVYKIERDDDSGREVLELVTSYEVDVSKETDMRIYGAYGITCGYDGTNRPGEKAEFTAEIAEGTEFAGWFDRFGNLLSDQPTFTAEVQYESMELYALNTDGYDIRCASGDTIVLSVGTDVANDATWDIYNETQDCKFGTARGSMPSVKMTMAGMNTVTVVGSTVDGKEHMWILNVIVDGTITKSFEWKYSSSSYKYSIDIEYSDYLDSVESMSVEDRRYCKDNLGDNYRNKQWVTPEDKYIVQLANGLNNMTGPNKKAADIANFILAFVQGIEQVADRDAYGVDEYWKYPIETLFDMSGDCEDTTFLYDSLMEALGYDTAILVFNGHMAAGLDVDGVVGERYKNKFYYCETAKPDWLVGLKPLELGMVQTVIPI